MKAIVRDAVNRFYALLILPRTKSAAKKKVMGAFRLPECLLPLRQRFRYGLLPVQSENKQLRTRTRLVFAGRTGAAQQSGGGISDARPPRIAKYCLPSSS